MYPQTRINSVSVCCLGLCCGHRVVRDGTTRDEQEVLAYVSESGITRHLRLIQTAMPANEKELETEIAGMIEADAEDAPLILRELDSNGRVAVVEYIVNKMEAAGLDPRADYSDLCDEVEEEDDDFDDDDDDDFDDDENDDRWPGDNDDDEG